MNFDKKQIDLLGDCINRGIEYIISKQDENGFWSDFYIKEVGMSNQWVTGYIGYLLSKCNPLYECMLKAHNQLLNTRLESGGWGYNDRNLSDADSTSNVVNFLSYFNQNSTNNIFLESLCDFLLTFSDEKTGGIVTYKSNDADIFSSSTWCKSEISVSAMTGIALLNVNKEKYYTAIDKIKKYLIKNQTNEGYWDNYWWSSKMYGTSLACKFLSLTGMSDIVNKAIEWVLSSQNGSGVWELDTTLKPSPFCTALALSTILTGHDKLHFNDSIWVPLKWLIDEQNENGSWTSDEILKLPNPFGHLPPWERPCWIPTRYINDQNNLFTTATIISILSDILKNAI